MQKMPKEKQKVIAFNEYGAKIFTNPDEDMMSFIQKHYKEFVINPDLSEVKRIPLSKWTLKEGQIIKGENKQHKSHPIKTNKEKIVYIDRPVEVIKEVLVDKIIEVPVELVKETIKEVIVEKPIETIKEIIKEVLIKEDQKVITNTVIKIVYKVPKWIKIFILIESLAIIGLLSKLI